MILLDMDGCVSDFITAACTVHHRDNPYAGKVGPHPFLHTMFEMSLDDFWTPINAQGEAFWIALPELPWAMRLYRKLKEMDEVVFCTSPGWSAHAASGKVKWLQRRFGAQFQDYVLTRHKKLLANSRTVLIDDHEDWCQEFRAAGGHAVVFPHLINSRAEELNIGTSAFIDRIVADVRACMDPSHG